MLPEHTLERGSDVLLHTMPAFEQVNGGTLFQAF